MARILMVSKAVAPPWNDGSKNLVRDLACNLRHHSAVIMTHAGSASSLPNVAYEPVYARRPARFAPALADNARVMARLLTGRAYDLWHFFFAPNPRSSQACAWAARLRRTPTVQTVCSAPAVSADLKSLLFADRSVVLSRSSEARALDAGVPWGSLRRIAPAVAPLAPLSASSAAGARARLGLPADRPLVVYPGDLEFSLGAERMLRAAAVLRHKHDLVLALACRMKTRAAREHEHRLQALAANLGIGDRVVWIGETPLIHQLLGAADVVALPAENLYAKVDLPLVLIEAMLLERAIVVAHGTPAVELCDGEAGIAVAAEVDAVAESIGRLLDDSHARMLLGARARKAAIERFDPLVVASAYEALYDELLR
jgi:glycosyltransferase involved in cell wall biosynthesis